MDIHDQVLLLLNEFNIKKERYLEVSKASVPLLAAMKEEDYKEYMKDVTTVLKKLSKLLYELGTILEKNTLLKSKELNSKLSMEVSEVMLLWKEMLDQDYVAKEKIVGYLGQKALLEQSIPEEKWTLWQSLWDSSWLRRTGRIQRVECALEYFLSFL